MVTCRISGTEEVAFLEALIMLRHDLFLRSRKDKGISAQKRLLREEDENYFEDCNTILLLLSQN